MTNIYNKFIIHPNGTLINNWFEEDELRRHTGEGRTIPGKNFPKKSMIIVWYSIAWKSTIYLLSSVAIRYNEYSATITVGG